MKECSECGGRGEVHVVCDLCGNSDYFEYNDLDELVSAVCPSCDDQGEWYETCPECGGDGEVEEDDNLD